jgi:hypothetical protein
MKTFRKFATVVFLFSCVLIAGMIKIGSTDEVPVIDYGPENISIDKVPPSDVVGKLFGPAEYPHKYHVELIGDCSNCHHFFDLHYNENLVSADKCDKCHASPEFDTISKNFSCDICHQPQTSFKIALVQIEEGNELLVPNLKAAYHRRCIECHEATKGPLGCTDCHEKKK